MSDDNLTSALGPTLERFLHELRIDTKISLPVSLAVDEMVAMRRKGMSFEAISDRLNEIGWPTPRGRGSWYAATVRDLLILHGPQRLAQEARKASMAEVLREEFAAAIAARKSA